MQRRVTSRQRIAEVDPSALEVEFHARGIGERLAECSVGPTRPSPERLFRAKDRAGECLNRQPVYDKAALDRGCIHWMRELTGNRAAVYGSGEFVDAPSRGAPIQTSRDIDREARRHVRRRQCQKLQERRGIRACDLQVSGKDRATRIAGQHRVKAERPVEISGRAGERCI